MFSKNLSNADEVVKTALIPPVTTYEMKNQAETAKMTTAEL